MMERVIDKAASDPEWKQRLLDEPEAAIREAGFPEAEHLRQIASEQALREEDEVSGQQLCWAMTGACHYSRAEPINV
jgi:hypothetical protein